MASVTISHDPENNLKLLKLVGETVYGKFWQKPMVAHLGMSQRQMVRWCNRDWEVPDVLADGRHLAVALMELLESYIADVEQVKQQLVEALPEGGRPGT